MSEEKPLGFGDNVRVLSTADTEAAGVAGSTGVVYGWTTPSVIGADVIGHIEEDGIAIGVSFEDRKETLFFAPSLLEIIDHGPGTEVRLKGVQKKWVRTESGEWEEIDLGDSGD